MTQLSGSPRVLVVDDEPEHAAIVATLLTRRGFSVQVMHSASRAIEQALASPPDLLLLDVFMPAMDGLTAVDTLRRDFRTRDVPILLVTASADDERVRARQRGLHVNVLAKPFRTAELVWAVELALARGAVEARS